MLQDICLHETENNFSHTNMSIVNVILKGTHTQINKMIQLKYL